MEEDTPDGPNAKPRVTDIGGLVFKCAETERTKEWYSRHLGLATTPYGSSCEFRNGYRPEDNKIQLRESVDHVFTALGSPTTK